jgi:hypothetical protein
MDVASRTPLSLYGSAESVDYNILQMLFCENMWPYDSGMCSVGFQVVEGEQTYSDFDRLLVFRDSTNSVAFFCPANGKNYVYRQSYGDWLQKSALTPVVSNPRVSLAFVDGRTFVFYEKQVLFEWLFSSDSLVGLAPVWPSGTTTSLVNGICAAGNYLIAYGDETIYWSSLTNPINFNDTTTGAGSQIPNQLRGPIKTVEPTADGFIIYTNRNAVAAFATNDAARPWSFREIKDCGGLEGQEQVSADSPTSGHYTTGAYGLQFVTMQKAETVLPDAADFLVSREVELWNYSSKQIEGFTSNLVASPRLNFIGNRYLFISYGWRNGQYECALLYDTQLRRWGKLRRPHVDIAVFPGMQLFGTGVYPPTFSSEASSSQLMLHENIFLLHKTGQLDRLVPSAIAFPSQSGETPDNQSNGVVVFGHIKNSRGRWLTLQKVTVDGAFAGDPFLTNYPDAYIYPSREGYSREASAQPLTINIGTGRSMQWVSRYSADNFDLAIEGRMDLTTVLVEVTAHGSR